MPPPMFYSMPPVAVSHCSLTIGILVRVGSDYDNVLLELNAIDMSYSI